MSVTISTFQNFVGGKWVDAAEGGTAEIINPSTGDTIAEAPNGTQADVDRDRKSTRLNSSHSGESRMPSSA